MSRSASIASCFSVWRNTHPQKAGTSDCPCPLASLAHDPLCATRSCRRLPSHSVARGTFGAQPHQQQASCDSSSSLRIQLRSARHSDHPPTESQANSRDTAPSPSRRNARSCVGLGPRCDVSEIVRTSVLASSLLVGQRPILGAPGHLAYEEATPPPACF